MGIKKNRIGILKKRGINSVEDLHCFFPRKYYDFRTPSSLIPENHDKYCSIIGLFQTVETQKTNNTLMVKAKVYDCNTDKKLNIIWIGHYYIYKMIKELTGQNVIVCGKLTYNPEYNSYHMNNPITFSTDIAGNSIIYPVYKKLTGISEEYIQELIQKSFKYDMEENLPETFIKKHQLLSRKEAIIARHKPKSPIDIQKSKARFAYEKLYFCALEAEKNNREIPKGTIKHIRTLKNTSKFLQSLPFSLSKGQSTAIHDIQEQAKGGKRVNALIQGDVGSGKTIVAFASMFAMADSGYQSILMAPTVILARQHYADLEKEAAKYGYHTVLIAGKQSAKEKANINKGIKEGYYDFIIGTHGLISDSITYNNLGMVIIDEEHRFGVEQRNALLDRSKEGVHTITMSATPIPRTIASVLYGSNVSVYDLELPKERKPVQTAIFNNDIKIYEFLKKKISEGQQAYIVCPYIDEDDSDIAAIENTYSEYKRAFSASGINIATVTGKMKDNEMEEVIQRFAKGEIQILIATTVIEVGVNVPSANVIVINNAERFGLAQLHQLRGRIGRGSSQGYCILKSAEKNNPRLQIMCKTTNGFEIAKEDMKLRGSGNLLGTQQSGRDEFVNLMLSYPKIFNAAKEDANEFLDTY